MARTRLSLIPRRDQTSAVEVWEESDGSIVTYQDGKPLVASAIDPVTGGVTLSAGGVPIELGGGGYSAVTAEHIPAATVFAATVSPASWVSRFGYSGNVAINVTTAGGVAQAGNIQIRYSSDAGATQGAWATIGTVTGNGTVTINIDPLTMPGLQFQVQIAGGTFTTAGTVGITATLS